MVQKVTRIETALVSTGSCEQGIAAIFNRLRLKMITKSSENLTISIHSMNLIFSSGS
jgi:hypothetical protein